MFNLSSENIKAHNDEAGVYKNFALLMRPCPKTNAVRANALTNNTGRWAASSASRLLRLERMLGWCEDGGERMGDSALG